ncbi:family 16 glycosylhydrolase [Streptomyces griseoaurantiacus]|uniref:Glycoside hydrolase family 16 protein n=1 Tax=Streptomyces griseoaurantiacus TaxID=68213 RepID=A0A7W2DNC6_9ACTN|nr:glycoside hydrolase family 16 protein [Streptomyces griseoaurantiacus]MBA5220002.1 glycoside hydrolase family 16 protein [Streptomyces griseoaurantiacus]
MHRTRRPTRRPTSRRPRTASRPAAWAAALALLAACAACGDDGDGGSGSAPRAKGEDGRNGWHLTWSDEFKGARGTPPDPHKWVHDTGGEPQWGNEEWQYYTDRTANAALDGKGRLVLTARRDQLPGMADCRYGTCDITSGRLTTKGKFAQAYGKFEARIRVPEGKATLPAFWMMGDNDEEKSWPGNGEIDAMEVAGTEPGTVYGTVHGPGYADEGIGGSHELPEDARYSEDFHTYGVEWTKDRVTWTVDGTVYHRDLRARHDEKHPWVFDHPFYLLLNLAVGGVWTGSVTSSTPLPARMTVDWVRVYERS